MEHLSGLILLFIAKNCGLEVTTQKKMKMERREKLSLPLEIPSEQNLRRPIPSSGDIVSVGRTRTNLTSQTKVCNLHKVRTLMRHMFKIHAWKGSHWLSGTTWPSVKKDYVWMTIMNCLWCLRKGTDHAKKVFRLHVSVKVAVLVHESQSLKHL